MEKKEHWQTSCEKLTYAGDIARTNTLKTHTDRHKDNLSSIRKCEEEPSTNQTAAYKGQPGWRLIHTSVCPRHTHEFMSIKREKTLRTKEDAL